MNLDKEVKQLNNDLKGTLDPKAIDIVVRFSVRMWLTGFVDGLLFTNPTKEQLQGFIDKNAPKT